jgi:hypothetical protein
MTMDTGDRAPDGTPIGSLWAANLLSPLAVLASLQVSYMFTDRACPSGDMLPVHLTSLAGVLLCLLGAAIGWREWRRRRAILADEDGGPEGRSRFLALTGLGASLLGALFISAEWSAALFFRPCQ